MRNAGICGKCRWGNFKPPNFLGMAANAPPACSATSETVSAAAFATGFPAAMTIGAANPTAAQTSANGSSGPRPTTSHIVAFSAPSATAAPSASPIEAAPSGSNSAASGSSSPASGSSPSTFVTASSTSSLPGRCEIIFSLTNFSPFSLTSSALSSNLDCASSARLPLTSSNLDCASSASFPLISSNLYCGLYTIFPLISSNLDGALSVCFFFTFALSFNLYCVLCVCFFFTFALSFNLYCVLCVCFFFTFALSFNLDGALSVSNIIFFFSCFPPISVLYVFLLLFLVLIFFLFFLVRGIF